MDNVIKHGEYGDAGIPHYWILDLVAPTSMHVWHLADEFGYQLVIDHGTEAHLLADLIAAKDIPVIIGPLFTSRSKVELRNRSLANPGRLAAAGVTIAITTDHPVVPIHFLIHQATLAVKEGLDPVTALRGGRIDLCIDDDGKDSVGHATASAS